MYSKFWTYLVSVSHLEKVLASYVTDAFPWNQIHSQWNNDWIFWANKFNFLLQMLKWSKRTNAAPTLNAVTLCTKLDWSCKQRSWRYYGRVTLPAAELRWADDNHSKKNPCVCVHGKSFDKSNSCQNITLFYVKC